MTGWTVYGVSSLAGRPDVVLLARADSGPIGNDEYNKLQALLRDPARAQPERLADAVRRLEAENEQLRRDLAIAIRRAAGAMPGA